MGWQAFVIGFLTISLGPRLSHAWFETCDSVIVLEANGTAYIESPYFPQKYPSGTSCRYEIIAPLDYEITVQCDIALDKPTSSCGTEYFYVSRDDDKQLRGSDYYCGRGKVNSRSLFNRIVLAYTSSSSNQAGLFRCQVRATPQACDCGWSLNTKITGGTEAQVNEFPSLAALVHGPSQTIFCGANIISHRYVVTAAHCMRAYNDVPNLLIVVGEHDTKTSAESQYTAAYRVDSIKLHEKYNPATDENDIALLRTTTDILWSKGVGPICLPLLYSLASFTGYPVDIAGWGTTSFAGPRSTVLQKATVRVISNEDCMRTYTHVVPSEMCTNSTRSDSCQFDSGGPVIIRSTRMFLAGVISYGFACGTTAAVNTRVTSFLDWIETNTWPTTYCRKT